MLMDFVLQLQALGGLFVLIFFYHLLTRKPNLNKSRNSNKANSNKAPEPAGAWPIIGHLPVLGGKQTLVRTLGDMADKYGPTFVIRLGVHPTLMVSSWEVVKECFTTNDKFLATRPIMTAGKYMGYNNAVIGFAPFGPYWREIRKIATVELLSNHRLEMLRHVRASEIDMKVKDLYVLWATKNNTVEMKQWFNEVTLNGIVRMVVGKRRSTSGDGNREWWKFQEAITRFFYLFGVLVVSDVLPFLGGWLDVNGHEKAMKKTAEEMDSVLMNWLEEHRRKKDVAAGKADHEQDFMDVMLSILEDAQISRYDPDTIIKATSLALILGGTDTTAVTLTWALSLLLNNRHILKKAQDELDTHVGMNRHAEESDIKNLVYLQAIVKETFRLYPPSPLLAPHEAMEDCNIAGYQVPKGTRVVVNLWKLHRDPRVWSDPVEFRPERFLTSQADVDVRGQHFEYIPFGSGRRSCPGISFALQVVHLTLARLLHGFELSTPLGEPVDMTERIGFTSPKATPLEVLINPRLPSKLYI